MSNPSYSQGGPGAARSSTDRIPQNSTGVGETARLAVGDKVRHRLSGAEGAVVDLHADPFVKDLTHGIVNWVGDGDGFGQGYANTNLVKF